MEKLNMRTSRVYAGLTIDQACEKIGVSKKTLISWEKYETLPRADQIEKIIETYGRPYEGIDFCCP